MQKKKEILVSHGTPIKHSPTHTDKRRCSLMCHGSRPMFGIVQRCFGQNIQCSIHVCPCFDKVFGVCHAFKRYKEDAYTLINSIAACACPACHSKKVRKSYSIEFHKEMSYKVRLVCHGKSTIILPFPEDFSETL